MQIPPPEARTRRIASFRVTAERFFTSLAQWSQNRMRSLPRIFSQSSVQGLLTSTESIKLFLDIVPPQNGSLLRSVRSFRHLLIKNVPGKSFLRLVLTP